jgi:hypothetical protein
MKTLIILFSVYSIAFGQNVDSTKKNFLETLDYNNLKTWTSCNQDSSFFKSDTIFLDDIFNYIDCREYVTWRFDNLKSFHQFSGQSQPSGISITKVMTDKDYFKFKIIENKDQTFLNLYNKKVLVETFIILNAGYDNKLRRNRLSLKRVKR